MSPCHRRHVLHMDRNGHVCLSTMGHVEQGSQQASHGELCTDSDHTLLAKQGLVSHPVRHVYRFSGLSTAPAGSPQHAPQWNSPWGYPFPRSSHLLTIFQQVVDQGFSSAVSCRMTTGHLPDSTQLIYELKWSKFTLWCAQRDIDPKQAPVS